MNEKRKRKGYVREMAFCAKLGGSKLWGSLVALNHHHGGFSKLFQLWPLFICCVCVHQDSFLVQMYAIQYVQNYIVSLLAKKGLIHSPS